MPPSASWPSARLTDLSQGAIWGYVTYPGETSVPLGTSTGPAPTATGHKYMVLAPAGSAWAISNGFGSLDTTVPGALLRLEKTVPKPGTYGYSATSRPYYSYEGTFRQDPASGDVFLLRLSTGELLDQPAKVLPGRWNASANIHSQFVVGGVVRSEYTLTVDDAETITTSLGQKPVWLTTISSQYTVSQRSHLEVTRQWVEPTSGNYLQATSRDTALILSDYSVTQIKDDEKISSYSVFHPR